MSSFPEQKGKHIQRLPMTALQPVHFFPLIKSNNWAQQIQTNSICTRPFFAGDIDSVRNPVISYCLDMGENVTFLKKKDMSSDMTTDHLHDQAMQYLHIALADVAGWQDIDFGDDLPNMNVITLSGNFYCSEGILSSKIMQRAHKKLNTDLLAVSIPYRGKMFAIDARDQEQHLRRFVMANIRQYFSANNSYISPIIWNVADGNIIGYMQNTETLERIIEVDMLSGKQLKDTEIQVSGMAFHETEGHTILLLFITKNWKLLVHTAEHVSQTITLKYNRDKNLSGRIKLVILLTETIKSQKSGVTEQMEQLVSFLNHQMLGVDQGPNTNQPFTFSFEFCDIPKQ